MGAVVLLTRVCWRNERSLLEQEADGEEALEIEK
jgi:hypothetical protein